MASSKLSEEQVLKNAEVIEKLIETFPNDTKPWPGRQDRVKAMFLEIGTQFYSAPASSQEDFHCCYPGGLAEHSLRVVTQLRKIAEALAPGRYDRPTLDFVGLMHDLGKIGDVGRPLYVPNPSDWHRQKLGRIYEVSKDLTYMPICDRTLYLLQKFGVSLSEEEYIAIRISDGPLEKCNEKYGMKEPDLAILLHMADRWSCSLEKRVP